ncbi:hypothetical protein CAPTEDRAFT_179303 [Capitella teleta]|uniref:CSD domain-containing protein n=1 Tax=Capitella teleta TaxID=283909 RepID=R7TPA2_CAPTE|nr:hypothetical protein CAPTEDRAFT_179303 [Capitella teleta]|eukprot:ELT95392.1 hypothetical protein CAPTEDRAFT_179303 [Capitella teleta]
MSVFVVSGEESTSTRPRDEQDDDGEKRLGRCKWFNVVKGYGFITPDDGGQDVFVHQTVIQMQGFRSLAEGEQVLFECRYSDKGVEATLVCSLGGGDCRGSERRPISRKKFRKIRCYNCGDFGNHIAAKCPQGPLPKRCHFCKSSGHLIADCPDKKPGEGSDESSGDDTPSSMQQDPASSSTESAESAEPEAAAAAAAARGRHRDLVRSSKSMKRVKTDRNSRLRPSLTQRAKNTAKKTAFDVFTLFWQQNLFEFFFFSFPSLLVSFAFINAFFLHTSISTFDVLLKCATLIRATALCHMHGATAPYHMHCATTDSTPSTSQASVATISHHSRLLHFRVVITPSSALLLSREHIVSPFRCDGFF